jgi:hypothetical protein
MSYTKSIDLPLNEHNNLLLYNKGLRLENTTLYFGGVYELTHIARYMDI